MIFSERKGMINIAENDMAQTVANRAVRKLYSEGMVRLYCKHDYKRIFDVMHQITCKLRSYGRDVVWKVTKYRNANDVTISEFVGYFHENGHINENPFGADYD